MNILLVGGRFDKDGGRPSGYVRKLRDAFVALSADLDYYVNGGTFEELKTMIDLLARRGVVGLGDVVLWFADVPNDEEKLVARIKKDNPKCVLVTSKRNELVDVVDGENIHEYPFQAVVAHALRLRSNLVVQFWHANPHFDMAVPPGKKAVYARVFDPLGNEYVGPQASPQQLARRLLARTRDLTKFTRVKSVQVGPAIEVPNQEQFFKIIKLHAERFHELVNPQQTDRFLGNASFRCDKGFPSFREGNLIFVSRRNVDKRYVGPDAFVAVNGARTDVVEYYGDHKPSVDTPIQLRLYRYWPHINYMLHGHVYVEGGVDIKPPVPIPCGAIEEVEHITGRNRYDDIDAVHQIGFNLLHHGCLIGSQDAANLIAVKFERRPAPEPVLVY